MWLLGYAVAAVGLGIALLLMPGAIRQGLIPDWAARKGTIKGTSLAAFRFTGLCFVLMGLLAGAGFFLGSR
jgi:hypothetical protein